MFLEWFKTTMVSNNSQNLELMGDGELFFEVVKKGGVIRGGYSREGIYFESVILPKSLFTFSIQGFQTTL